MNIKKIFGMLIALCAVLCITLAMPVNAVAEEQETIPLVVVTELKVYKIAKGSTTPCETSWVNYNQKGIYVDIDTSEAGFTEPPLYFTSISGKSHHWKTMGASSIYNESPTGFRVYIYKDTELTPDDANEKCWHINWMAIGK